MQLLPAIEARRSIRRYAPGEIPKADLEAMLAAAMLAPSACNTRPWEFFVIRDAERKAFRVLHFSRYHSDETARYQIRD